MGPLDLPQNLVSCEAKYLLNKLMYLAKSIFQNSEDRLSAFFNRGTQKHKLSRSNQMFVAQIALLTSPFKQYPAGLQQAHRTPSPNLTAPRNGSSISFKHAGEELRLLGSKASKVQFNFSIFKLCLPC